MDLVVGRAYRAKNPAMANGFLVNDRVITWISSDGEQVQYDGPSVAMGRRFPIVSRGAFEKWASHDLTDALAIDEFMGWSEYQIKKAMKP